MASNRGPGAVGDPPENIRSDRDEAYYKARDSGSSAFNWAQQPGAGQTGSVPGGVGGSWASAPGGGMPPSPRNTSFTAQARQPAYGVPAMQSSGGMTHAPPRGSGGAAAADGSHERNLIMDLCPPGGMKAEPPPDKLAEFARAVPSLNPDLVCPAILDCLEDGQPWIIRAKALCVMETILRVAEDNTEDGGTNAYADFFFACRGEIEPLASHPRAAINEPANRVLRALGLDAGGGALIQPKGFNPPKPAGAATWTAAEAPNLLDFDDEPPVVQAPAPPPTAAPPVEPPASGSLFGGLTTKGSPAQTGPPQVTPPTPAANATFPVEPPAKTDTSCGNLFSDVQVKDAITKSAPPVTQSNATEAAPIANGSAFGFMNSNAAEVPNRPVEPAKEAFDPLLHPSASPNTAKATMANLTPAQMQALAYQQIMMQQQMQMAYAMQHQQMGRPMMHVPVGMAMPQQQGNTRGIMKNNSGAAASSPFSFMDAPIKKEDKKFDFVKDAMKDETKK